MTVPKVLKGFGKFDVKMPRRISADDNSIKIIEPGINHNFKL